jgi:hypothetical protein
MRVRIPCSSAILSEARLYAIESRDHTMDYDGWKDQHHKLRRLTYGKFAQLWVYEFCRINDIECLKDGSSPKEADRTDLTVCGFEMDVKASTIPAILGQISPGMYGKSEGFYCFILTNEDCGFVMPAGVVSCADYMRHSIEVKKDEIIPNTNIRQRFGRSRFLQAGSPIVPFFDFMDSAKRGDISRYLPPPLSSIEETNDCPF